MSRSSRITLSFLAVMAVVLLALPAHAVPEKGKAEKKRKRRGKGFRGIADPTQAYGWSYYRYTRYDKKPHLQDKHASMLAGGDVKCDVCEVILAKALRDMTKARLITGGPEDQEKIEEHLEADQVKVEDIEKAKTRMEKYVEKYKKGCNRLFKENFLREGWDVVACHRQLPFDMPDQPPEGRIPWACARDMHEPPSNKSMNTYTVERESIHYACEATITRHREDVANFITVHYEEFKKQPPKKLAREACEKAAKCKVRKPTETEEARARKMVSLTNEKNGLIDDKIKSVQKELKKVSKERKQQRRRSSEADVVEV